MVLSKPTVGATGWNTQVDALFDRVNELDGFDPDDYPTDTDLATLDTRVDALEAAVNGTGGSTLPQIREVLHFGVDDGAALTTTLTTTGTVADDTLIAIQGADWNLGTNMPDLTGDVTGWELLEFAGAGVNVAHVKVWKATASVGGALDVTFGKIAAGSDAYFGTVVVFEGAVTVEDSNMIPPGSAATSHDAPAVTATGDDQLLLSAWVTPFKSGGGSTTYTAPGGMTSRSLHAAGATSGGCGAMLVATEAVDAGATGVRTATYSDSRGWVSASLVLSAEVVGSQFDLVPTLEELQDSVHLGDISATATKLLSAVNFDERVTALTLGAAADIAASDTNYWTVALVRYRAGTGATIATRTTQVSAPNGGVDDFTGWDFDLIAFNSSNRLLEKGDLLALTFTKTGTAPTWTGAVASWRYEPGVTA